MFTLAAFGNERKCYLLNSNYDYCSVLVIPGMPTEMSKFSLCTTVNGNTVQDGSYGQASKMCTSGAYRTVN